MKARRNPERVPALWVPARQRSAWWVLWGLFWVAITSTSSIVPLNAADSGIASAATNLPSHALHNVLRAAPGLFSGSSPNSEAAFLELGALGIATIVSVDGARPDLERARRHGMRYVHLPVGYDGISALRQAELIRAARDSTGAVYVHCHHGRHRGPAALAVICAGTVGWSTNQAREFLRCAGTSADYPGLYQSVAEFRHPDAEWLASLPAAREVAAIPPLVDVMVAIDHQTDYLKAALANGWKPVAREPDRTPLHAATLLKQAFRELARLPNSAGRPIEYRDLLVRSETEAAALEDALRATGAFGSTTSQADLAFRAVTRSCAECHRKFRN